MRASNVDAKVFGDIRETEKGERDRVSRKVRVANYASDVWVPRGARQMQIMPTNFSENSRIRRESRPNIHATRYVRA